jgi:hypothetical protein
MLIAGPVKGIFRAGTLPGLRSGGGVWYEEIAEELRGKGAVEERGGGEDA